MKLLKILLAEEGEIGSGLKEELGDDSGHAIEMAGPERAAKSFADAAHRNGRGEAVGIDFPRVRRIQHMRAEGREFRRVVIHGARISG